MAAVTAMTAVVVASNVLVQHPVQLTLGRLDLADILTWGAFTYPIAFLVTDLTNRSLGVAAARRIVYVGFVVAVLLSIVLATPRIAVASGTAFLVAQLIDVTIFDRLRRGAWWRAPALSSFVGSAVDTIVFFSLAFAASFALLGPNDPFATEAAPLLGLATPDAPRWVSWALGDFAVKLLMAMFALLPYRAIIGVLKPPRPA